ncbi:MAG TPA: MotA/TolQ/ExbB proton channel family protein [Pirellulales bacterium]|jgi:biopolymer transport protein ExbB/TolQ|nr:MotA/TolQ/ExbB proton channel family protein [Pirellulales bacterium]
MAGARKSGLPKVLDLPLAVAAALTFGFYWVITQEAMKATLLHRYTTEHTVEYIIVGFFIWGLVDAAFRVLAFPRETLALKQAWLPPRKGREPIGAAASCSAYLQRKPLWLQHSRIGLRFTQALAFLQEKGSADGLADYLQLLSDQDHDETQTNYGLIRFICWVTPMFGFLGTVVHFGTALSGQTAGEIGDKLPTVVAEMGTAFNTTTVALTAATTMMFCLFLCERTERGIVHIIDQRVRGELLNRFEVAEASLGPFLAALEAANQTTLRALDETTQRQIDAWADALDRLHAEHEQQAKWQAQAWLESLEKLEGRFETNDAEREKRLARLLATMDAQRSEHRGQMQASAEQLAALQADFARMAGELAGVASGERDLVRLQASLAENLKILRETQQIDHALHGLTAAIHLLTARHQPAIKESRAA